MLHNRGHDPFYLLGVLFSTVAMNCFIDVDGER